MRRIETEERRRRLAVRHGIAPGARYDVPEDAVRGVVALHATEPATVYLSLTQRVDGVGLADVSRLLYDDRSLVKQLAMRRTLWATGRDLLPALLGSASARVAATQRRSLAAEVQKAGVADDGEAWVERAFAAMLDRLADGSELSAAELREQLPELTGTWHASPEKAYGAVGHLAPRVLTALGATGAVVRGSNAGGFRTSRPRWTLDRTWLGAPVEPTTEAAGYDRLVGDWLARFGPGTETDLVWWLGATKAAVRGALGRLEAAQVLLESGETGWVLPGDVEPTPDPGPWAALLPVLDPTTMGWKQRAHYLDDDLVPLLFDRNGNAGTTAWWCGRIVGCWVQDPDGRVRVRLGHGRADLIGATGRAGLAAEAERLTALLDGEVVATVYPSALMRADGSSA